MKKKWQMNSEKWLGSTEFLWASKSFKNSYQRMQMIDILLKYILWHEFLNYLDAQSDFDKKIVTKKLVN